MDQVSYSKVKYPAYIAIMAVVTISVTLNFILGFFLYTKITEEHNTDSSTARGRSQSIVSRRFQSLRNWVHNMGSSQAEDQVEHNPTDHEAGLEASGQIGQDDNSDSGVCNENGNGNTSFANNPKVTFTSASVESNSNEGYSQNENSGSA